VLVACYGLRMTSTPDRPLDVENVRRNLAVALELDPDAVDWAQIVTYTEQVARAAREHYGMPLPIWEARALLRSPERFR
jgi:hypothetical protein